MLKQIRTSPAGNLARVQALSHARLRNYRAFFGAANDAEVLGLYLWNEELCVLLFRTIAWVEVVLRNQFHRAMSMRYGVVGSHGSRDWYDHVELDPHARSKIREVTHYKQGHQQLPRVPVPSPNDVVSRLSFGFWPHLLDLRKDLSNGLVEWGSILVDVFPGHRQRQATYWAKLKHRDALFARLDLCNELRNRIAHHEPIWKLGPLLSESRPRQGVPRTVEAPAPSTPAEALVRLRLLYGRVTELFRWVSPDVAAEHARTDLHLRCQSLMQLETVLAYQRARPPAEVDLARVANVRNLRKALRLAARRQQPVFIRDGRRVIGQLSCAFG